MNSYGYSIALFFHLVSLVAAGAAAALSGYAALRLRAATSSAQVTRWGTMIEKVVRICPRHPGPPRQRCLHDPKRLELVDTVDRRRAGRSGDDHPARRRGGSKPRSALKNELQSHDLSERARRLMRDPLAWTAERWSGC